MPIKSEIGKGLIYAGETPLALTIKIEQTGLMQLTVRAGSFTTTGRCRKDRSGKWLPWDEMPVTYVLTRDYVLNLQSDLHKPMYYDIDLVSNGQEVKVEAGPHKAPWKVIHALIFPFAVPSGATNLDNVDIYVWTVLPGFPPGTEAKDWAFQKS